MARSKKKANGEDGPSQSVDSKAAPDTLESGKAKVEQWCDRTDTIAYEKALELYPLIQKAFEGKEEQADRIEEFWSIYNAIPDENQQYIGNSQGYVPAVRDALNARAKRALKQLFPANHKHVDGLSADGDIPYVQLSLLEYYARKLHLKSIIRTMLIAGDVSGQWNLYIDWTKSYRRITKLVKRNAPVLQIEGEDVSTLELEDPLTEEEAIEDDDILEEGPEVVDFATEDLAVVPPTCSDIQKAFAVGIRLRMSPTAVRRMVDEGVFILPENTDIKDFCKPDSSRDKKPSPKKHTKDAGIKTQGTDNHALIYEVHAKLNFGTKDKPDERRAIVYFAAPSVIVGLIKSPYWNGKVPIISAPVDRVQGSFFGRSKIEPVKYLQWNCTDFFNMGQDAAMYSMMPIYAVNPMTVPQWMQLTMGLAAMWPAPPNDIKPLPTPQLWKESMQMVDAIKRQIWESLDVNEMMMGRMPAGRKNNQLMGQMQQEQSTNISDHASRCEDEVLNPLMEMLFEFDQQFRTAELMIESRGEIGVKAKVKEIPVQQWGERYFFRWVGTEYMVTMQLMQQQIALANVLKGFPPQMLGGKRLDLSPMAERATENVFGPDMAPRILVDERNMFFVEPEVENQMLYNGFDVPVHEGDDDPKHLQSHMIAANMTKDENGYFKKHMMLHMAQLQKKREMQMGQQKPGGLPGGPPGAAPSGVAGTPRPGALPAPQRPAQAPAGAIQQDNLAGAPGRG